MKLILSRFYFLLFIVSLYIHIHFQLPAPLSQKETKRNETEEHINIMLIKLLQHVSQVAYTSYTPFIHHWHLGLSSSWHIWKVNQ